MLMQEGALFRNDRWGNTEHHVNITAKNVNIPFHNKLGNGKYNLT